MTDERKPKQKTPKGLEIPVPTKGDFDAALSKSPFHNDPAA
jgi:hypothetical protein